MNLKNNVEKRIMFFKNSIHFNYMLKEIFKIHFFEF